MESSLSRLAISESVMDLLKILAADMIGQVTT